MTRKFLVPLLLPADPAAALEAATKRYVDSHAAAGNSLGIVAMGSWKPGLSGAAQPSGTVLSNPLVFTPLVGRRYVVHASIRAVNAATAGGLTMTVWRDGFQFTVIDAAWTTAYIYTTLGTPFDGDGVAHTYEVRMNTAAASFTPYLDNIASNFYIEDVGPNSAPALPIPETPPAWTTLTPINGWTAATAGSGLLQYRKIGDVVTLRGQGIGGAHNSVMTVLPAGFRPPTPTFSTVNYMYQGAITFGLVTIYNNGNITVQAPNGAAPQNIILDNISFSITP